MDFRKYIFSRRLPKTGQVVSYQDEDDGDFQTGWWQGRIVTTNRTRFVVKTIDGDVVVVDRATGLMWAGDANAAGCNNRDSIAWGDCLDYAYNLEFAGFVDWRIPNSNELPSIINHGLRSPALDDPPFLNPGSHNHWTSTTYIIDPSKAWFVAFGNGVVSHAAKTEVYNIRCVRLGI